MVAFFCYLEDMLSAAGGCEISTMARVKTAWKEFKELIPVLSSRHFPFKTGGRVYSSCVWSTMVHAIETWPLTKPQSPASAGNWQSNDQTDLQCKIARHCHHQVHWATPTCTAWHWRPEPHAEGEKGPLVWMHETLQPCCQDSLWYIGWWTAGRLMDRVGLGGPRWIGSSWQWGIAESGRSSIRAACQQPERGPTDVDIAPVPAR